MSPHGRGRPSPGTLIALIALVAALTGTAQALPGSNQVDNDDLRTGSVSGRAIQPAAVGNHKLKDGAVTDVKIADGSVINPKISDGAVTSDKIADDSVAGRDVDESTLGEVPSAKALSYQKPFNVRLSFGDDIELISQGPLSVRARCLSNYVPTGGANPPIDTVQLYARTTIPGSFLNGFGNLRLGDLNGNGLIDTESLDPGDSPDVSVLASGAAALSSNPNAYGTSHVVDAGYVASPDGDYIGIEDGSTLLGLRVFGADCVAIGKFELLG